MSTVNLMAFFKSSIFPDCVSEIWDEGVQDRYKREINRKIENMPSENTLGIKNMGEIYRMMS
jgi:hypothetical protein